MASWRFSTTPEFFASFQLQLLSLSKLPKLLVQSYQGSKNRFGDCSISFGDLFGDYLAASFGGKSATFDHSRNFAFTQLLWLSRFGLIA